MKQWKIILLLAFIILWYYFRNKKIPGQTQYKVIQKQNDSLQNSNQLLEQQIQRLQQEADRFQQQAQQQQQLIRQLQTQQDEKMQTIRDFDSNDLYQFFAKYKTAYSTTD